MIWVVATGKTRDDIESETSNMTMDWTYYTLGADGFLRDDDGDMDVFQNDGKTPVRFDSAAQAEAYLEANDIRGNVR